MIRYIKDKMEGRTAWYSRDPRTRLRPNCDLVCSLDIPNRLSW
jgi:hypothetical protein